MNKIDDEILQERLDELLMVEQKAEARAKRLTEYGQHFQEQAKRTLERLDGVVCTTSNELCKLKGMNSQLEEQRLSITKLKKKIILLFVVTIIVIALIFCGAYAWFGYLQKQIKLASLKLELLDLKLSSTPKIMKYHGADYIRIIPGTEGQFESNGEYSGNYAKVWYDKRRLKLKGN